MDFSCLMSLKSALNSYHFFSKRTLNFHPFLSKSILNPPKYGDNHIKFVMTIPCNKLTKQTSQCCMVPIPCASSDQWVHPASIMSHPFIALSLFNTKKRQFITQLPFGRKPNFQFWLVWWPWKGPIGYNCCGWWSSGINLRIRRAYVPAASVHRPRPWQRQSSFCRVQCRWQIFRMIRYDALCRNLSFQSQDSYEFDSFFVYKMTILHST